MDQKIKSALKEGFQAPPPERKEAFLQKIAWEGETPKARSFFLSQVRYIRKSSWLFSIFVLAGAIWGAGWFPEDCLWMVSAIMPMAAVCFLTENLRSEEQGMWELEMASRFSLKSVMLARMGIMGGAHLILLGVILMCIENTQAAFLGRTGVYLLVPYFLTAVLGMELSRNVRGKEAVYGCLTIAVIVSTSHLLFKDLLEKSYEGKYFLVWLAVLCLLIVRTVSDWRKVMRNMEELRWN